MTLFCVWAILDRNHEFQPRPHVRDRADFDVDQSRVESALAHGWPAVDLTEHLVQNPDGVRDPVRVLARRLTNLAQLRDLRPLTVPWCGECEDTHSRTISVTEPDGTEVARFCPQCSPQAHKTRPCEEAIHPTSGKVVN